MTTISKTNFAILYLLEVIKSHSSIKEGVGVENGKNEEMFLLLNVIIITIIFSSSNCSSSSRSIVDVIVIIANVNGIILLLFLLCYYSCYVIVIIVQDIIIIVVVLFYTSTGCVQSTFCMYLLQKFIYALSLGWLQLPLLVVDAPVCVLVSTAAALLTPNMQQVRASLVFLSIHSKVPNDAALHKPPDACHLHPTSPMVI